MLWTLIVILLVLALIGGLPTWNWSATNYPWVGYSPALLIVVVVVLVLALGRS